MKKTIAASLFLLSSSLFAMTATTAPSSNTNLGNTINTYEPGGAPGTPITQPLDNNWNNNNLNDNRKDIQEEVDPCYDLSGNLLPGCSEKMLRDKTKRPRRSNGGAQDRLNPRGYQENNTTQTQQSSHP
jgi:hypothetical protein